jgi:aspartokinase-like uncharacterized kinase
MTEGLVVVKVGGSLFDLPDLGSRLQSWLVEQSAGLVLLVPGGGAAADVVRGLQRDHQLDEETAHWLALRALSVTAHFLHALLPGSGVVACPTPTDCIPRAWGSLSSLAVLDPHLFLLADEGKPGCLPHSWQVTSDAIAARAAVVAGAKRLILLKSVTIPAGMTWEEAGQCGYMDGESARVLKQAPSLEVVALNFRSGALSNSIRART